MTKKPPPLELHKRQVLFVLLLLFYFLFRFSVSILPLSPTAHLLAVMTMAMTGFSLHVFISQSVLLCSSSTIDVAVGFKVRRVTHLSFGLLPVSPFTSFVITTINFFAFS